DVEGAVFHHRDGNARIHQVFLANQPFTQQGFKAADGVAGCLHLAQQGEGDDAVVGNAHFAQGEVFLAVDADVDHVVGAKDVAAVRGHGGIGAEIQVAEIQLLGKEAAREGKEGKKQQQQITDHARSLAARRQEVLNRKGKGRSVHGAPEEYRAG